MNAFVSDSLSLNFNLQLGRPVQHALVCMTRSARTCNSASGHGNILLKKNLLPIPGGEITPCEVFTAGT